MQNAVQLLYVFEGGIIMALNIMANGVFSGITPEEGLKKALSVGRGETIKTVTDSGLKGRGGAGFPAGVKWNLAAVAKDPEKYIVCNADEGEPGTFKDRVLLSDYSDLLFEGMTIAGFAIGAHKGILYLRGEYRYLLSMLEGVLTKRREKNLLGKNICGSQEFNFDIEIRLGSGAYVCGEETALIESLEGQRGEPRNRPPFPVNTGYMGHPTVVNNVETLVVAARVLAKGAPWFKTFGTEKSTGTKIFSVSGDCKKPGVYELPMGIKISELLKVVGGEDAKAVVVGGASGHAVPAKDFGRIIAYEDIATGGAIIVFGPHRNMLTAAKNFMEFFVEESCGQCTPCRFGNIELLKGVEKLEKRECSISYLNELKTLGETMKVASKCGLGQSSPNAFISIVENFPEDIFEDQDKEQGVENG
jgi:[NiFe] hydrogenase diaphorase moiety large subunit